MGQTALLPFQKEGVLRIFSPWKDPTALVGFETANLGTKGQHATSRPPKPLILLPLHKVSTSTNEKGKLSLSTSQRHIRTVEVYLHSFLHCALGGESLICRFTHRDITPGPTEQNTGWTLDAVWIVEEKKIFYPWRKSNPGPFSPFPSHYSDWTVPSPKHS